MKAPSPLHSARSTGEGVESVDAESSAVASAHGEVIQQAELVEIVLRHGTQTGEVSLQVSKTATMQEVKDVLIYSCRHASKVGQKVGESSIKHLKRLGLG